MMMALEVLLMICLVEMGLVMNLVKEFFHH